VMAADQVYSFAHVPLRQECLFFPDHGVIAIPFMGSEVAFGVPFHPSHFTAAVRNPASLPLKQIKLFREDPTLITALSIGLDACRRVVIPSSARATNDESTMRGAIKEGRDICLTLTKAMLDGNAVVLDMLRPRHEL